MNRYKSKRTLEIRSLALREATKQIETVSELPKPLVITRNIPRRTNLDEHLVENTAELENEKELAQLMERIKVKKVQ